MPTSQIIFIAISVLFALFALYISIRRKVSFKRSVDMVFLRVIIARKDSDSDEKKETVKDFREQISIMEQLFASLKSLYSHTVSGWLFGQEYISLEYVAHEEEIYFYVVVPRKAKLLVEKQIIGFYPDCLIEETEEVNIFANRKVVRGEIMKLKKPEEYPIRTYQKLETDSMNAILSALGRLDADESACVQILLRPVDDDWQDKIKKHIRTSEKSGKKHYFHWNPLTWLGTLLEIFANGTEETLKKEEGNHDE